MKRFEELWIKICKIYLLTKHYTIIAEELSDDFITFIQPMKEHRDVLDHIARVYGYTLIKEQEKITNVENYKYENMKKALAHAYRAFFDTADWLTYTCRKQIRILISDIPFQSIVNIYPRYNELKESLSILPEKITSIREHKDISDDPEDLIEQVDEYVNIMDCLIDHYKELFKIINK